MEGPRPPLESEYKSVLEFLDQSLRPDSKWSISSEYPTALGLSNINNIRIITENKKVLSHAVLKPLIIKSPLCIYKVAAIGSVVTDSAHRNQGLSHQVLENCLEEAKRQECDIAMLWTNLYDFYRKLGFELSGCEYSFVFESNFETKPQNLKFLKSNQISHEAIYRLYSQHTVGTARSPEDIRKFLNIPNTTTYSAWDATGQLVAYAIEGKGIDLTDYIHEWGGKVTPLLSLLSHIRKDKNKPFTLIAPKHSENLINELKKITSTFNEGYLGMIKIVCYDSFFAKIKRAARTFGISDLVLERRGPEFVFGIGKDLVFISEERALTQIIFGPTPDIDSFSEGTKNTLAKIFPLPLWVWGWDSV
jgi:hypothetical protein